MSEGLFRKEVTDAKRGDWCGSRIIATSLSRWVWTLLAQTLAGFLIAFPVFGHYTRRESVTGQPGTAISTGGVSRVWVHDGQTVHKGDLLVEICSGQDSVALGNTQALIGQQLGLQQRHLQQNLRIQQQLTRQQADALRTKITLFKKQQSQIAGQLELQQRQVASAQSLLERIQPVLIHGRGPSLSLITLVNFERAPTTKPPESPDR